MSESTPTYIRCQCQHCEGGVEFDANEFTVENRTFPCPHCGLQMQLSVPEPATTSQQVTTEKSSGSDRQKSAKVSLKSPRVTLTKTQCTSAVGQAFVGLLIEIGGDGILAEDEVRRLHGWLKDNSDSDIPAIGFLWRLSKGILRDGKITQNETLELQLAIERVLPKETRSDIAAKRQEVQSRIWKQRSEKQKATEAQLDYIRALGGVPPPWLNLPDASDLIRELLAKNGPKLSQAATDKQVNFIRDLGGQVPNGLTKSDASMLIEQLLANEQPTPRQMMILRFWNRMDLAQSSKNAVSAWLEGFYSDDPRRKAAWELFKYDTGDDGSQHDPSTVPVGAGMTYLNKLSRQSSAQPVVRKPKGCLTLIAVVSSILAILLVLIIRIII